MRKFMTAVLLAATAFPAMASAQSNRELQRDRREIQEERQDLRQAQRSGDRRDVRDARGDLRDARQEYREDLRDRNGYNRGYQRNYGRNDWRDYRGNNRSLYARGNWRAPFRYNNFRPGVHIGAPFYAQRFVIADPYRYRLPRPIGYQRWVRHYNDVLLIDTRRGFVVDVIRNFYF
jgi:Ni/Co efflux regulator RcnB